MTALSGCSTLDAAYTAVAGSGPAAGNPGFVRGFLGAVAADEPRAALTAREVLSAGGTAADAAVALGAALMVTLPSRAGPLGGGACLSYVRDRATVEAISFPANAPADPGGDRPAAAGSALRGLFLLHNRAGSRPFGTLVEPAEQLARQGFPMSRALARDLAPVTALLAADPGLGATLAGRTEGDRVVQPDLGATFAQVRVAGVGDLHQGALARRVEDGAPTAGAALTVADLRAALPATTAAESETLGPDRIHFMPGGGVRQALAGGAEGGAGLPASTSFTVLDRQGNAVACMLTQNNLFGTGRTVPGTGIVLAAAPTGAVQPPVPALAIATAANLRSFRAASAGSGQGAAPLAAAAALRAALAGQPASSGPEPGRANVIGCARYLPGNENSCAAVSDPRGAGIALGGQG